MSDRRRGFSLSYGFRIAAVATGLFLVTLALLPLHLFCLAFHIRLWRRIPRLWHRAACFLIGIRIHVHGELLQRRPLMIASNHSSWKDIIVLGAIADVVYISKAEVKAWPILGTLARLQRTIFVVREERRKAGRQVNEIAERLVGGEIVVLFPEGTTSDGNRLFPIKSSLFGAAVSAVDSSPDGKVHVQPVAIAYTGIRGVPMGRYYRSVAAWPGDVDLMPHLKGVIRAGAIEVDVSFGEPVEFEKGSNRKQLSALIEERIRQMLSESLRGHRRF